MTITIHSNGSKWAGQEPDDIETLIGVLDNESNVLDRRLLPFVSTLDSGDTRVFGNFIGLSHVFRITGNRDELAPLIAAVERHTQSDRYLANAGQLKCAGAFGREQYVACCECDTRFPVTDEGPQCNGKTIDRCPWCRPDSSPWKNGRGL